MIEHLMLAAAIAAGLPWPVMGALVLTELSPTTALVLWVGAAVLARRHLESQPEEALLMMSIAGELRAGQSLRGAIAASAGHPRHARSRRLAQAGSPIETVAGQLATELPGAGRLLGAVIEVSDRVGGPAAAAFEQLAAVALTEAELKREKRTAVVPALIQASLVGGVPLVLLGVRWADGSVSDSLARGGVETVVVMTGIGLVTVGAGWVGVMVRKALR